MIRDPRQANAPEGATLRARQRGGQGRGDRGRRAARCGAHPLFTEETTGSKDVYVGLLEAEGGAEIPRHTHEGSEEILYVISGGGELTVGSDKIKFGREQAIHIPDGPAARHQVPRRREGGMVLQAFAPGGPETERFKAAGKARSK